MQNNIAKNKELIESYFHDVWNKGEVDLLDKLLAPDYINHSPGMQSPPPGPVGLKPIIIGMRKAIPDLNYEIQDLVITEDKIVARVKLRGTHLGELWGIKPSGGKIEVNQINIEHIRDGRIVEHWRLTDDLTLMKQLT